MADAFSAYLTALQHQDFSHQCLRLMAEREKIRDEETLQKFSSLCRDIVDIAATSFREQSRAAFDQTVPSNAAYSMPANGVEFSEKCREKGLSLQDVLAAASIIRQKSLQLYLDMCHQDERFMSGLQLHANAFDRLVSTCANQWLRAEASLKQRRLREANHFILQERRRYRSIFNRMKEPAIVVDKEHKIVDANKAFEFFFETDRKKLIGQNCSSILGQVMCEDCRLRQAMEKESSFADLETELQVKGSKRNVLVSGIFLGEINGQFSGGIVILQDITEKKRYERDLRQSEEKYRSLIENVPDVTWRGNEKGHIIFVSPNIQHITGYEADKILGEGRQGWLAHIHPEDRDMVASEYASLFTRKGKNIDFGYRFQRSDGIWIWFRDRTGKVYEVDGIRCVDGVLSDITKLKLVENELAQHHLQLAEMVDQRTEELRVANERLRLEIDEKLQTEGKLLQLAQRLRESNAELEQFAQVASHDMKEPLVLISAFAERLEKRCFDSLDEKGREYVRRIISSANKLRNLINALLELARVTTKPGQFQSIDLQELLREVVEQLEEQLRESGGEVKIHSSHSLQADRMQVWQLFQNILGNAIKYRRPGIAPIIVIKSRTIEGELCEISIEDNGIGFSQDEAERIFIPFERLHPQTSYEGTGIGLATCRKIVARHGGEIMARSIPGRGATFVVRLPLRRISSHIDR